MGPRALTLLAMSAAVLVLFSPILLGDYDYVLRDHLDFTYPSRAYLASRLSAGQWPSWWPSVGLGVPFAANPIHGATYPLMWITAILPAGLAANLPHILHALLAGCGIAALSRRFGAAPVPAAFAGAWFIGSGYVGSMFVNGIPYLTLAWTPWVACAAWDLARSRTPGKTALLGAAAFGMQIMSGDPAGMITSALLATGLLLARKPPVRRVLLWCALPIAGLLLATVTVWPAMAVLEASPRAHGFNFEDGSGWSMHPMRFIEWFWPHLFGLTNANDESLGRALHNAGRTGPVWADSLHVGALVLVLAGLALARRARRTRWVWPLILAFVLLALGRFTPVYGWYRAVVLPEALIRYPERHVLGALVLIFAFAGVGLTHAAHRFRTATAAAFAVPVVVVATGLALLVAGKASLLSWLAPRARGVELAPIYDGAVRWGIATAAIPLLILALAAATRGRPPRIRRWALTVATGTVVMISLFLHSWSMQEMLPGEATDAPPLFAELAKTTPRPRFYMPGYLFEGARHGIEYHLARYHNGLGNILTLWGGTYFSGYMPDAPPPRITAVDHAMRAPHHLLKLMQRYAVTHGAIPAAYRVPADFIRVGPAVWGMQLYKVPSRPRGFATSQWHAATAGEVLAQVHDALTDEVFVETAAKNPTYAVQTPTPCQLQDLTPEHVRMTCTTTGPAVAVLQDGHYPGWRASVGGVPQDILVADGLVRAVRLPAAGTHVIDFVYPVPRAIKLGALISGAAWALWAALLWFSTSRARRAASRPMPA